jgi:hypothetical protein
VARLDALGFQWTVGEEAQTSTEVTGYIWRWCALNLELNGFNSLEKHISLDKLWHGNSKQSTQITNQIQMYHPWRRPCRNSLLWSPTSKISKIFIQGMALP